MQHHPAPADRDESLSQKVDALLDDQSQRWRRGDPAAVEDYLADHPELKDAADYLLDLIYHEVVLRTQRGQPPELEEYLARFPHLDDQLRLQFQIHQVISPEEDTQERSPVTEHAGQPTASQQTLPAVPGYAVLSELGQGGMGVVYRARHLLLNRLVALKMLRGGVTRPLDLVRFRTESALVARLDHPNIVRVYDVGDHAGAPYFSMELVDGVSLAQVLRGAPVPAPQAAALIQALAQAIGTAHASGIVHRDLKPANILLQGCADPAHGFGQPKITDFGLAKQLDADAMQTRSGDIVGTPSYMAPEQARGRAGVIGPATDVYALGAILYEMLTGRPPFRAETLWDTLEQVVAQEPLPPRQLHPKVPRDLETICLKCLHKEPARRYVRAADLAEDLRRFLAREPITARPASAGELAWQWLRRHPTLAAVSATATAVLLVLSIGHYLHLRSSLEHALAAQDLESGHSAVQAALHQAETAVQAEQWQRAAELLQDVPAQLAPLRDRFPDDARLAAQGARAEELRRQTDLTLTDQARYRQLLHHRAGISFHAIGFTGLDAERNLRQMREQVTAALHLYGLMPTGRAPLPLAGTSYTSAQQATIAECCFEMLVNLADAVLDAQPRQDATARERQAREALVLLERAAALPVSSAVIAPRRARILGQPAQAAAALPAVTRPCELFLAGTQAYRAGELTAAADHLQNALKLEPGHVGAQYALAVCYLKQRSVQAAPNRLHLAVYRLSQCIDAQPGHVWPYLLRGYAYSELDEFAAAEADFAHVSTQATDDVARYGVHVNRGLMRIRQGKLPDAAADLAQAIALKPGEYPAHANLAQVYQEQRRWTEARAHLDQALRLSPPALQATLYRTRARLHQAQGAFSAALDDYDRALKHEPRGLAGAQVPGDLLEKGRILVQQGKYAEAVAALDAALALQPGQPAAQRLRAEALLHLDRFAEAVQALTQCLTTEAVKRQPLAAVYLARGRAQSALGKFAEAVDDYTRALELQPENAVAQANRGWAYVVLDAYQLALRDFEKVVAVDPTSADGHNGRAYALVRLGQYRRAVEDAERALKLSTPRNARNIYNASRTYAQAAARSAEDRLQQPARAQELRQQYQERAVALLREALQALRSDGRASFWKRTVEPDPALLPLRRCASYLQLAQEYQEAVGSGPPAP